MAVAIGGWGRGVMNVVGVQTEQAHQRCRLLLPRFVDLVVPLPETRTAAGRPGNDQQYCPTVDGPGPVPVSVVFCATVCQYKLNLHIVTGK